MRRTRPNNSGFVLLAALLVLVIAGTVLAAWARRSCALAARAGSELERLQVRWGARSCHSFFLPRAEEMLKAESAAERTTATQAQKVVTLGPVTFRLVLEDEQAKANANTLAKRHGSNMIGRSLLAVQSSCTRALHVDLRPSAEQQPAGPMESPLQPYSSLEQLFAFEHPRDLAPSGTGLVTPSSRVTCWGSGKVNFKRADISVLREMAAGALTESELAKLLELRYAQPDCTLEEAIKFLELKKEQVAKVRQAITDESLCHSLWIVAQGQTRSWYFLCIDDVLGPATGAFLSWRFTW